MTVCWECFCHFDFKFQQGVKIVGKEEKGGERGEVKDKRQAGLFAEFYWLQNPCPCVCSSELAPCTHTKISYFL